MPGVVTIFASVLLVPLCLGAFVVRSAYGGPLFATAPEFPVSVPSSGYVKPLAIDTFSDGGLIVVWENGDYDQADYRILARRFDATGTPTGSEFQVNVGEHDQPLHTAVSTATSGEFVVVWSEYGQWSYGPVHARRFDAAALPAGGEFSISTQLPHHAEGLPAVDYDSDGRFIVAWGVRSVGVQIGQIVGQWFDANGNAIEADFPISGEPVEGLNRRPQVIAHDGRLPSSGTSFFMRPLSTKLQAACSMRQGSR